MRRRSFPLALAVAAVFAVGSFGSAVAGTVHVNTDSGSLGVFRLTNHGNGDFQLDLAPPPGPQLFTINGSNVLLDAYFDAAINFKVTSGLGSHDYVVSSGELTTRFFSPDSSATNPFAELKYELTTGESGHLTSGLLLAGMVTSVPSPLVDVGSTTYNFSSIASIQLALAATDYTGLTGSKTMWNLFNTPGATAIGTASFAQAVPEPTSVALMGIGLGGLIAFRRRFAKRAA